MNGLDLYAQVREELLAAPGYAPGMRVRELYGSEQRAAPLAFYRLELGRLSTQFVVSRLELELSVAPEFYVQRSVRAAVERLSRHRRALDRATFLGKQASHAA